MNADKLNRRNFFRLLAGAVVTPKVSYFLPPIGGWHSDVIVNPNMIHISEIAEWPKANTYESFILSAKEFYEYVWIPYQTQLRGN